MDIEKNNKYKNLLYQAPVAEEVLHEYSALLYNASKHCNKIVMNNIDLVTHTQKIIMTKILIKSIR